MPFVLLVFLPFFASSFDTSLRTPCHRRRSSAAGKVKEGAPVVLALLFHADEFGFGLPFPASGVRLKVFSFTEYEPLPKNAFVVSSTSELEILL